MAGTRIGGKKSAKTVGSEELSKRGSKGGAAKVKKGFAVSGKAREAGRKGGKATSSNIKLFFNKLLYGIPAPDIAPNPTVRRQLRVGDASYTLYDRATNIKIGRYVVF